MIIDEKLAQYIILLLLKITMFSALNFIKRQKNNRNPTNFKR
jgi:hypothetical protein